MTERDRMRDDGAGVESNILIQTCKSLLDVGNTGRAVEIIDEKGRDDSERRHHCSHIVGEYKLELMED